MWMLLLPLTNSLPVSLLTPVLSVIKIFCSHLVLWMFCVLFCVLQLLYFGTNCTVLDSSDAGFVSFGCGRFRTGIIELKHILQRKQYQNEAVDLSSWISMSASKNLKWQYTIFFIARGRSWAQYVNQSKEALRASHYPQWLPVSVQSNKHTKHKQGKCWVMIKNTMLQACGYTPTSAEILQDMALTSSVQSSVTMLLLFPWGHYQ